MGVFSYHCVYQTHRYEQRNPTSLTDCQWQILQKIIETTTVRRRKYPLRNIINGTPYIVISGYQWRMLPQHHFLLFHQVAAQGANRGADGRSLRNGPAK